jgi:hypothetical protein
MEQFTIGDSGIYIRGAEHCWRCGKSFKIVPQTTHHGIPQTMQPMRNVEIPICKLCHDELNKQDVNITAQFVYKIQKTAEELNRSTKELLSQSYKAVSMIDKQIEFKREGEKHDKAIE